MLLLHIDVVLVPVPEVANLCLGRTVQVENVVQCLAPDFLEIRAHACIADGVELHAHRCTGYATALAQLGP